MANEVTPTPEQRAAEIVERWPGALVPLRRLIAEEIRAAESAAAAEAVEREREACAKMVDTVRNELLRSSVESDMSLARAVFAEEAELMKGLAHQIRSRAATAEEGK